MTKNPFDNVGILEKVLTLNGRRSFETFQRKTLNVRVL